MSSPTSSTASASTSSRPPRIAVAGQQSTSTSTPTSNGTAAESSSSTSTPQAQALAAAAAPVEVQGHGQGQAKSKAPKAPKPPKAEASTEASGSAAGAKAKSAKELKKEKRAALVAARGPSDQPQGQSQASHSGSGPTSGFTDASNPQSSISSQQPRSNMPQGTSSHTGAHGHGHGAARRPPILSSDSTLPTTISKSQSELFFSHLAAHKSPNTKEAFESGKIHPLVVRLGMMMASGTLRGANARTIGMMRCWQEVIRDYETPESAVMWKDLMSHMSPMIAFLEGCRPKGQGGGNAIRWLKSEINRIGEEGGRSEAEQRNYLVNAIDAYLEARVDLADQVISDTAREKIRSGDTVVTYARSSVVERVLLDAWSEMREKDSEASFSVVVVDSRPLNEGRNLLDSLTSAGIPCTYTLLTQSAHLISRSSLVLLGASALHSDGALYSRAGTAMVAMVAKEHRIPVVACVETYKFGERVQLDAVANNELGQGADLFHIPPKSGRNGVEIKEELRNGVTPLCLLYDLTPPELITAVCTEIGFIPPSSVPTVLGKGSGVQ